MLILTLVVAAGGVASVATLRVLVLLARFAPSHTPRLPSELDALPTVSICIPARNETNAMTQCLERVTASTYPKLEIIVLDDASVDNTSILIKSFAHAGVRFVEGSALPEGWLGKNHALAGLFREASGELVLYMDVDTYIRPETIDHVVATALAEQADMVSVLPMRSDVWRLSSLFATLRHFWVVLLHRQSYPAASSSLWMVRRSLLAERFREFEALRATLEPERAVAGVVSQTGVYRFLMSDRWLGVSYEKKWSTQCETSRRLLYPRVGGHIVPAVLLFALLALFELPFLVVASALAGAWTPLHATALGVSALLMLLYTVYIWRVWRRGVWLGGLVFPIVMAQEMCLLVLSVYGYLAHTVTWKGRPVVSATDAARPARLAE